MVHLPIYLPNCSVAVTTDALLEGKLPLAYLMCVYVCVCVYVSCCLAADKLELLLVTESYVVGVPPVETPYSTSTPFISLVDCSKKTKPSS